MELFLKAPRLKSLEFQELLHFLPLYALSLSFPCLLQKLQYYCVLLYGLRGDNFSNFQLAFPSIIALPSNQGPNGETTTKTVKDVRSN
jgi:hypothetical protein